MYPLMNRALASLTLLTGLSVATAHAQAGTLSNTATVSLSATRAASLTLTPGVSSATLASITDNSNANNFSPVSLTAGWNLTAGTTVNLVGWFSTPSQALANGTDFIPSSKVEGRIGATAFAPFSNGPTGGVGVANGSLTLFTQAVGSGSYLGTRTDQLDLRLNLAGTSTVAGNYAGTLNLQLVVQ